MNLVPALMSSVSPGLWGERVADSGPTLRSCRQAREESWHLVVCHWGGGHSRCSQASFWLAAGQRHSHSSCVSGLNAIKNVDNAT